MSSKEYLLFSWANIELMVILGSLCAFAPLATDMYLPSLPMLEKVFNAQTSDLQFTITTFFLGFAVGQALYGPIADRYGRKPVLYLGTSFFVATSVGCALSPSAQVMASLRFIQAVGACAGGVIARAMVRDLFPTSQTLRVYATLTLVSGIAPMVGPLIGGYMLAWFGWRAVFWFLAAYGTASMVAVHFRLRESYTSNTKNSFNLKGILGIYGGLMRDREFLGHSLAGGISLGGLFAYLTGSPFVFINLHHVTPQHFGWFFGLNAFGLMIASQTNGHLLQGFNPRKVLRNATLVQFSAGMVLLVVALTGIGGLTGIALSLVSYLFCGGFIMPNATALAMEPQGHIAGTASALMGTLQFTTASLCTLLVGFFDNGTALPMASVIALCGTLGILLNCTFLGPMPCEESAG